jgi:hypothetical protein
LTFLLQSKKVQLRLKTVASLFPFSWMTFLVNYTYKKVFEHKLSILDKQNEKNMATFIGALTEIVAVKFKRFLKLNLLA